MIAQLVTPALHGAPHLRHHFGGPHVDYAGVAVAAFASWIGVTGPGEAALIAAGIAAAHHKVDIGGMIATAWVGAMAGGILGWLIGLRGGRALMSAQGPLFRLRARLLRHGDEVYERRGMLAVYLAPTWMAGISGMRAGRFLPALALSALLWALFVGLGSYWAGPSIAEVLADAGVIGIAVLLLTAATAVYARRRRRSR